MAGDWIKMRATCVAILKWSGMVSALNADRLRVVGGLHAVWSVFDEQTEDGFCPATPRRDGRRDRLAWFSAAMMAIEWLFLRMVRVSKYQSFQSTTGSLPSVERPKQSAREASAQTVLRLFRICPHQVRTKAV